MSSLPSGSRQRGSTGVAKGSSAWCPGCCILGWAGLGRAPGLGAPRRPRDFRERRPQLPRLPSCSHTYNLGWRMSFPQTNKNNIPAHLPPEPDPTSEPWSSLSPDWGKRLLYLTPMICIAQLRTGGPGPLPLAGQPLMYEMAVFCMGGGHPACDTVTSSSVHLPLRGQPGTGAERTEPASVHSRSL